MSQTNSAKLIETLLLCLDPTAKQSLRTSLKQQKLKLKLTIPSEFNYASLLDELDYKEFEQSIYSYLLTFARNNNFIVRRSSMEPPSHKSFYNHVHLIAKSLFALFMRQSSTFKSLIVDKFCDYSDLPLHEIQLQQQPNSLLPALCNGILEFTVKICDFENEALVNRSIANVIVSQRGPV